MLKPLSVEMFRNFCTYTFHTFTKVFWSLCGLLRKQVFLQFKKRLYCHCTSKRVGRLFKSLHTSAPFSPSSNSQWNYIMPVLFEHVKTFTRFVCTTIYFPLFVYFFIKSSQITMKNGNYLQVLSLTRKCHFPESKYKFDPWIFQILHSRKIWFFNIVHFVWSIYYFITTIHFCAVLIALN